MIQWSKKHLEKHLIKCKRKDNMPRHIYLLERPVQQEQPKQEPWWYTILPVGIANIIKQASTRPKSKGIVGAFLMEADAKAVFKPGDELTAIPCFENVETYNEFRSEMIKQKALSKLSEDEKAMLGLSKPPTPSLSVRANELPGEKHE